MDRRLLVFFVLLAPVMIWSWIAPHDRFTWWLEAAPVVIGGVLVAAFHKKFPLTTLLLVLIWLHCVILLVGAHYTYARVPLFDCLRDLTDGTRNNYDKLGHFVQGFVPAILTRKFYCAPRLSPIAVTAVRAAGLRLWSPACVWRSVLFTNLWSGRRRCSPARRPRISSAPKATRGTRKATWPLPCSARSSRCCYFHGYTIVR